MVEEQCPIDGLWELQDLLESAVNPDSHGHRGALPCDALHAVPPNYACQCDCRNKTGDHCQARG